MSAPPRSPEKALPPLARVIRFDVCVASDGQRRALGERARRSLSRAGVSAKLTDQRGAPADFTLALRDETSPAWSAIVSILTLSVVPGYFEQRDTIDVDLAWPDAAHMDLIEHLQYQARTQTVLWLPLIVAPDVLMTWMSPKIEDRGFNQMVERLGDDLRARLGRDDLTPAWLRGRGVSCPRAWARPPT